MELWELTAREGIRDLVARYNMYSDRGWFDQTADLFTPEASLDVVHYGETVSHAGHAAIRSMFGGVKSDWGGQAADTGAPAYVRHMVTTHVIDLEDERTAGGRAYFTVFMHHGADHWGRYRDKYTLTDTGWKFAHRLAITDGWVADSRTGRGDH
jgi:hypothetical protein